MEQTGKLIALFGSVLALVGLVVWALGRSGFKGLPGDIRVESESFKLYSPVVTCLVVSVVVTLLLWLVRWLRGE